MSHSFYKIWIHAVWATKDRTPMIDPSIENKLFNFIQKELNAMSSPPEIINGMQEHIHVLFRLNPRKSLEDVIKQIKGSSSYFINDTDLIQQKFSWQTGYAAYSVSDSHKDKVFRYIQNQKQHHEKKTFAAEYDEFLKICSPAGLK